jgi:uncharacterized protein (DUF2252 family)
VVDIAFRIAGTSSLGAFRAAALVQVGDSSETESFRILDIKEVLAAKGERETLARSPEDGADRVLAGARMLCPLVGERMIPATVLDHRVLVRELLPQEAKLCLIGLREAEIEPVGEYLGRVVGRAHARQLSPADTKAYARSMQLLRDKPPPAWLWDVCVELTSLHEAAYLRHCRETLLAAA